MKRGLFITIEGGEGSGKTSLIRHLSDRLTAFQYPHIFTREPGGTPFSEEVRHLVLHSKKICGVDPLAELLLFIAARIEHVQKVIEPALNSGTTVLCDRFTDSSVAYQAYGRECDPEQTWQLCTTLVPLLPDLTFYLDISPRLGSERLNKRQQDERDRLESETEQFHERVRAGYLDLAKRCPDRIIVLDATQTEEELAREAQKVLSKWIGDHPCT